MTGAETILCTDDGSAGRHALVTEPLKEILSVGETEIVYACGPRPMLKFVAAAAKRLALPVKFPWKNAWAAELVHALYAPASWNEKENL